MEESHNMEIVAYSKRHTIPEHWIDRWQLLKDFREDVEGDMEWKYTSQSEFKMWLRLNTNMDESKRRREEYENEHEAPIEDIYQDLVPISSILSILQYMNATNGEYLLNTRIDGKTPPQERERLYNELGKWIRANDMRFVYREQVREDKQYQTHTNLGVDRDPASYTDKEKNPILFQLALEAPYDLLTGIIHTGYQKEKESEYIRTGERWDMTEAAWWRINWNDVRDFYFTQETEDKREALLDKLDDLIENEGDRVKKRQTKQVWDNIDKIQGSMRSMTKIVRIFTGIPVLKDPLPAGTASEGYLTFYPDTYRRLFEEPEELSLLLSHPEYFKLLARQTLIETDNERLAEIASSLFGLDVLVEGRAEAPSTVEVDVYASSVVAEWIRDSLHSQYSDDIPTDDYEYIISSLLNKSSIDLIRGIHTLLTRLNGTDILLWRRGNARLLREAVESVLASAEEH